MVELYEALARAPDERARVRIIAAAFERSRNTLLMWLVPLMFAQVGATARLVRLL